MFSNRFGVGVLKHPGYNGKGGGSQAPQQNTSYQTNIPEYAEPYVHNMLTATQKQLFEMDNKNNITGFKPYTPYSKNMNDYVAGFSPLQQRAQQNVANMQMPGQFGMANQMAGAAGLGSLGLAGQAANAGNQFRQQATNPYDVQQYMNPYLQASLDPQIESIRRQYGITGTQQQGQATQLGAFGGSREALMAAENNRAMNSGINSAITQGYNNAFNNAQQQQQFGANLGLQGYQTGLSGLGQAGQAASTLGQLGGQEQAAQQNIINAQNTMGAQVQASEQQKINQAIQDYATAQQYPMMQLGMMSNMIRGLPLQGVTTQSYQAQPNFLTQGIGALGTGYALQNALGGGTPKAAGGQVKAYAKGGIASYDMGGAIESDLYDYSPEKLKEILQTSQSETVRNKARAILREKTSYAPGGIVAFAEGGKSFIKEITPEQYGNLVPHLQQDYVNQFGAPPAQSRAANPIGVTPRSAAVQSAMQGTPLRPQVPTAPASTIPTSTRPADEPAKKVVDDTKRKAVNTDTALPPAQTQNAQPATAGGYENLTTAKGILAGMDPEVQEFMRKKPQEDSMETLAKQKADYLGPNTGDIEYRKQMMAERANSADEAKRLEAMRMAEFFSTWGSTPGPTLVAGMQAAQKTIPNLISDKKEQKKAKQESDRIIFELDRAARLEKAGNWDEAAKVKESQAKAAQNWSTKHMDVGMQASQNKTRLEAEAMSTKSAEKIARERNATEIQTNNARNAITSATSLTRADQVQAGKEKALREDYDKAVVNGFIGTIDDYVKTHTPGGTALSKSQWKVTEEKNPKKG